ncbi:hypothetical protein [Bifidobacterium crudilactis]|jgi:hypothetical protein|uniref:hypothetical protein n=1 Tax=Bifidobacterium crudilactis TaxID=327277 RepID=UPI0026490508|nr:hypothetical protein [Bifidobacterium crudilactis]MDN5972158.1 hypothetical protein [Bifidobacterium crudilactis]MDN6000664.1 hypothetical protein [Bifidobacterium crudilactis]MDN6208553.1 hypothetical protein [Bifidobacterium crudilactis]MDN6559205.1 hypothetical protein [Bifidobacterium crudilactis]MDN6772887.1 hypothetical protein [Bifidobacterium crudilactis]
MESGFNMAKLAKNRKRLILVLSAILVAIALLCATVISRGVWHSASDGGTELEDNVVIYGSDQSRLKIRTVAENSITAENAEGIEKGTVIASGVTKLTPSGLLRKVTHVKSGANGQFILDTEPAALTDAIRKCDVRVVSRYADGKWQVKSTDRLDKGHGGGVLGLLGVKEASAAEPNYNILDKDGGFYYANYGMWVETDLKVTPRTQEGGAKRVQLSIIQHVDMGAGLKANSVEANVTLLDKDLKPSTFMVGALPIVLTHHIEMNFAFKGALEGGYPNIGFVAAPELGFTYDSDTGFASIVERGEETGLKPREIKVQSDGQIVGTLNDSLTVAYEPMLYGVAGFNAQVGLGAEVSAGVSPLTDEYDASSVKGAPLEIMDKKYVGDISYKFSIPYAVKVKISLEKYNIFDGNAENLRKASTKSQKATKPEQSDDQQGSGMDSASVLGGVFGDGYSLVDGQWPLWSDNQSYRPKKKFQLSEVFHSRTDGYGSDYFQFNISPDWKEVEREQRGSDQSSTVLAKLKGDGFSILYNEYGGGASAFGLGGQSSVLAEKFTIEKLSDTQFVPSSFSGYWNVPAEDQLLKLVVAKVIDSKGTVTVAVLPSDLVGNDEQLPPLYASKFSFLQTDFMLRAVADSGSLTDEQVSQVSQSFATLQQDKGRK